MYSSPWGTPDLCPFLFSWLGRWRSGWHHEQQRAVSRFLITHLLNFTKKCQKKKKKFPWDAGTPCQWPWPWACQVSYWSVWWLNKAQKNRSLSASWSLKPWLYIMFIYLNFWSNCEWIVLHRPLLYTSAGSRLSGLEIDFWESLYIFRAS